MGKDCNAKLNATIPCAGIYLPSTGCCARHAGLFDIWIRRYGGSKVYGYGGQADARKNTPSLRAWKRGKFHEWLNTLTVARATEMLAQGDYCEPRDL